MRGGSGRGGSVCDEFDSCGLEESISGDDVLCVFGKLCLDSM